MENLLQGLDGVAEYLDDIIVRGSDLSEHKPRSGTEDIRVFWVEVEQVQIFEFTCRVHLGHIIYQQGLHLTEEKVRAIKEVQKCKNLAELRSFLNYYISTSAIDQAETTIRPILQAHQV